MAVMHPPQLSETVLGNPRLRGEIKVYNALSALPDEYEIFYNRSIPRGSASRAYARRIDFVVLHEKYGFLAIEVKGGKIRIGEDGEFQQYHPSNDRWARIDPYKQVELSTMELIRNAKADGANYYIVDNTCVIFPDTRRRDMTDAPNRLPNGTLCADDLAILPAQMKTLFLKTWNTDTLKRESFLDMRRRLNNMPEAARNGAASSRNASSVSNARRNREADSGESPPRGFRKFDNRARAIKKTNDRSEYDKMAETFRLRDTGNRASPRQAHGKPDSGNDGTQLLPASSRPQAAPRAAATSSSRKTGAFFDKFIDKAMLVAITVLVMFLALIALRKP